MEYSIKLNAVDNPKEKVKAFASVTLGDSFKITNVAVVEGKEKEPFVSMPSFKSKARNDQNQPVYKDMCNPITKEFREELYGAILGLYGQMEKSGKMEIIKEAATSEEPGFEVNVTPLEREGSNILGLARIYFENSFVVGNVSILNGGGKAFVAMPSYKTNQTDEKGKPRYQDVCFPVTKEFREKLYGEILKTYKQEKEREESQSKGQTEISERLEREPEGKGTKQYAR